MPKLMKQYPANTGMVHRGLNETSPFADIVDALVVKNGLSSRAGYLTLGALPATADVFETLEIGGDFYEILVTLARELYVFKNGTLATQATLRPYTGGRLSYSNLGNVIALWDKAQTVLMLDPPVNPNPNEGFIVVSKTVDYNTTIQIQHPDGEIKVLIGDPTDLGYPTVDATRGVDAVARSIAQGGSESWSTPAAVLLAAYDWADGVWNGSGASEQTKSSHWATFATLAAAYEEAARNYQATDTRTEAQRIADNAYWSLQAADAEALAATVDITADPYYIAHPSLDYLLLENANLLTPGTQKTTLINHLTSRDEYQALADSALVAPDNAAILAAYTNSIQAIVDFLSYCTNNWWIGYMHHGDWAQILLSTGMAKYLAAAQSFLVTQTPAAYRGNVVYYPDMTGISVLSGDEYLTLIQGKVLNPLELPRYAPLGTVLRVEPIPGKGTATYTKATPKIESGNLGALKEVSWEECAAATEPYKWDQTTMPTLIDLIPTVRIWNELNETTPYWRDKKAGDIELCPNPLLVGGKIVDIARGANRLLLLGDNASLSISELGKRQNLFRVSTLLLYPTDAFSTSISGEKPANLYKISTWGSHIAILGSNNIFKMDLSNSIDATFPKMTRGVGWGGKQALTANTEADLLLVGEEMYSLSYGEYGIRVTLNPLSSYVNLPQNLIKVLYDPIRKNIYLIAPNSIWVSHFVKDEQWAWTRLTVPGTVTGAWLETQYLRLSCTHEGKGALLRLPLYPSTTTAKVDAIRWSGFWNPAAVTTPEEAVSVGARTALTLSSPKTALVTSPVVPSLALLGSEAPGVGGARISRAILKTRGECEVATALGTFSTLNLRTSPGDNSRDLTIPVNMAGNLNNPLVLNLLSGEVTGISILYVQGKANLGGAF